MRLARGILDSAPDAETGVRDARAMVTWAVDSDDTARRTIAQAFRMSGTSVLYMHELGARTQPEADALLRAHLESGGNLRPVVDYIREVHAAGGRRSASR